MNQAIASIAGRERTIELAPDFEAVAGLRGRSHKPERAWRGFAGIEPARVPVPLAEAVTRIAALWPAREPMTGRLENFWSFCPYRRRRMAVDGKEFPCPRLGA